MLYVALTGRLPFPGRSSTILARKLADEPPPPSSLVVGIPADLDALCVDLLRRDPSARPTGARSWPASRPRPRRGDGPGSVRRAAPAAGSVADAPDAFRRRDAARGSIVPLIGRERHREILRAAFESVRGGTPEIVLVSGRSGSGKSTLLQAFLDEVAAREDAVVLPGRCYERESVPYKAIDSVVDALSRYLKTLPEAEVRALLPRDIAVAGAGLPGACSGSRRSRRRRARRSSPRPAGAAPPRLRGLARACSRGSAG